MRIVSTKLIQNNLNEYLNWKYQKNVCLHLINGIVRVTHLQDKMKDSTLVMYEWNSTKNNQQLNTIIVCMD